MYTIEEFDKGKTKILKYILYKKRSENEVRRKFEKEPSIEEGLLVPRRGALYGRSFFFAYPADRRVTRFENLIKRTVWKERLLFFAAGKKGGLSFYIYHITRRITMDVIKVEKRNEQTKANQLRRSGLVPCCVYGGDLPESISIQMDQQTANRLFHTKREGSQVGLELDGRVIPAQIKEKKKSVPRELEDWESEERE